ncbi:MAG: hypothetical protein IKW87_04205 [Ruminococcus sp.]|nr:hypothetical protein [Ruminococcus sp.]
MVKLKNKNSIQELIGFERFTKYGVRANKREYVFYHVEPTNISVLSPEVIANKIRDLSLLLSSVPELEIMAIDSCECFDENKAYLRRRLAEEKNQAVRKLLESDLAFMDEIQAGMSSAREFLFIYRFRKENEEQVFSLINRIGKAVADHGFMAHRLEKAEIKRMLGLYFGTSIAGGDIPDVEYSQKGGSDEHIQET